MLRKLIGLIIIILLFVFVANAQLQGPTPGTRKEIKAPQKQSPTQQQKPEPDKRGTEQTPFVVKTISTPKSQAETEQDRKEQQEKASQIWWAFWLTVVVAAATFLQAIFLYFGLRETKKASDAAKESADAIQSAERAYLFVEVRLNYGNSTENEIIVGDNHIEIITTNLGRTPAVILNIQRFCQEYPNKSVIDDLVKNMDRIASNNPTAITPGIRVIGGGDSGRILNTIFPVNNEQFRNIGIETVILACLGVIQYKIVFNKIHKTVFCWEYEPRYGFGPDENPRHNYHT